MKYITLPTLIFLFAAAAESMRLQAQDNGPINTAWLEADLKAIASIPNIMPLETRSIEELRERMGEQVGSDEIDLGFGARRINLRHGTGYTTLYVTAVVFKDAVIEYEIGVWGSGHAEVQRRLERAWSELGLTPFGKRREALFLHKRINAVFDSYAEAVAGQIGHMKIGEIPARLKGDYDYLISPMNHLRVGKGGFGYAGVVPREREAIDALVAAKAVGLIENVLRGYNPEGRVYAAIALMDMKNEGVSVTSDALNTADKISNLPISLEWYRGCVIRRANAREIVERFSTAKKKRFAE